MTIRFHLPCLLVAAGVGVVTLTPVLAHDPITTRVTWNGEISRIVQARCVSCHAPGGRAPMPLTTWQEARPWAKAIKEETMTRRMPLWHAARGYGDLSNDPSLSTFEIALIAAWADGGAPLGTDAVKEQGMSHKGEDTGDKGRGTGDKAQGKRDKAEGTRQITTSCRDQSLPSGTLLGVAIAAAKGDSVGIAAALPDGKRDIIVWIRAFDPEFATTYWLRTPLGMPRGSRLVVQVDRARPVDASEARVPSDNVGCSLTLTMAERR